ncbi:MAG: hypothetical protein K2X50_00160 [Gammaproteobacteria bacterium]|nr:hypothetical protein [Gammaproteobacteria bacterium]
MNKVVHGIIGLSLCFLSAAFAEQQPYGACGTGLCGSSSSEAGGQELVQYNKYITPSPACAPGDCYLFNELVNCSVNDYSCKDGRRRIWSYRAKYYAPDNTELLVNLDKKLCPTKKTCMWPYSQQSNY